MSSRLFPFFFLLFFSLIISCGKKSPPTLKSYEKPAAPSGLAAIHREDSVILSWNYPENLRSALAGFLILRDDTNGFERLATVGGEEGVFHDNTAKTGISYTYKVIAQSLKNVSSGDSNIITVAPKPLPPSPVNIRFAVRSDFIELTWDSSGEGVCYNVYRTVERGKDDGILLNKKPICSVLFRDPAMFPDKNVYYTVRALFDTEVRDEGYASREVEVSSSHFIPSPPSDLRIVAGDDKVFLIWKESPESWVRGYRIYRMREGDTGFQVIGEVNLPAFTDTEVSARKVRYSIRALGPSQESESLAGEAAEDKK